MIVGGYSLDLYCDNRKVHGVGYEYEFPHTIEGEFGSTCRRLARKRGWKFSTDNMIAVCPNCTKAGVKLADARKAVEEFDKQERERIFG